MIRRLLLTALLLIPCVAYGADPGANLSVTVVPPSPTPPVPAAAATAGFNTLALNSDFSQPQPTGWFGCIGSGPGHIWYAGIEGGDTLAAPCSTTGGTTRYNLVTDALTGTQALPARISHRLVCRWLLTQKW